MRSKIFIIIMLLVSVFTLTACSNKKTDALKFKEEYESLNGKKNDNGKNFRSIDINKDNPIVYSSASDIVERINNKETFVVYFGFAKCPWCRSVVPTLLEVSEDIGLDTIYYVDILEIRDILEVDDNSNILNKRKGTKSYYKLLNLLGDVLDEYLVTNRNNEQIDTNEKRIYAPNVVSIINGKAEKLETGISDKLTDPYMKLTKKIKKDTYNKFKCSLKCVVDNKNSCSKNTAC